MKTIIRVLALTALVEVFCLAVSGCSDSGPYGFSGYYIEEKGKSVSVDGNGNVYVAGVFSGTADLNPGPGVDEHTSTDLSETFVSAFDSSGSFLWARTWCDPSNYSNKNKNVAVVAADGSGSAFVAGSFEGKADLDPGPGVDEHIALSRGVFLSKLDSQGNYLWGRSWGALDVEKSAIDIGDNIYITGDFGSVICYGGSTSTGSIDFDPGPETDYHSGSGVFLSKFDSEGDFMWAATWDKGKGSEVAVDEDGCVYLTGIFDGGLDFDPGPAEAKDAGTSSPFLCKLDPEGNFSWVSRVGGIYMGSNTCIAVGRGPKVFVGGSFSNHLDYLGSTSDVPLSRGKEDIFLAALDSDGNPLWRFTCGGSGRDFCHGVTVDSDGNVYATGYFSGKVDFDPGPSSSEQKSRGGPDVYLAKFDPSGNFLWVRTWGSGGWDKGNGIAFDGSGSIYVTGEFCGRVDFDPGPGRDWHTSTGYNDTFLSKFDLDGNFIWARTWGGYNPTTGT